MAVTACPPTSNSRKSPTGHNNRIEPTDGSNRTGRSTLDTLDSRVGLTGRTGHHGRIGRSAGLLVLSTILLVALSAVLAGQALATTTCDLYAAPGGSDNANGTVNQPFASVQHLADTLTAGETGCVRGNYTEEVTVTNTGSPNAPITITSYPGERATLTGRLWIHQGANYVTVSNMNLDGRNTNELPSPDIDAAHTTFTADDVTDEHTAICFDVGSDTTYGHATNTIIQGNRIHDCGKLPAANHDHGIYVESSTDAQILENVIYDNSDRGIQLYPDAQQTTIEHNIIDSNGEGIIFSGDFGDASSNNTITNNLITNSTQRADIESWYPTGNPIGENNTVENNCVWGGATGTIEPNTIGFTATNNTTNNPEYANPTTGDYRINNNSPCANLLTNTNTPTQPFTTTNNTITYTNNPNTNNTAGASDRQRRGAVAARLDLRKQAKRRAKLTNRRRRAARRRAMRRHRARRARRARHTHGTARRDGRGHARRA